MTGTPPPSRHRLLYLNGSRRSQETAQPASGSPQAACMARDQWQGIQTHYPRPRRPYGSRAPGRNELIGIRLLEGLATLSNEEAGTQASVPTGGSEQSDATNHRWRYSQSSHRDCHRASGRRSWAVETNSWIVESHDIVFSATGICLELVDSVWIHAAVYRGEGYNGA